jgi:hypothetical protein
MIRKREAWTPYRKKMKLTRLQAKRLCLKKWKVAKNTGMNHNKMHDYIYKTKGFGKVYSLKSFCGYCEKYDIPDENRCKRCPLYKMWKINCYNRNSLYYKWKKSEYIKERKQLATQIYNDIERS